MGAASWHRRGTLRDASTCMGRKRAMLGKYYRNVYIYIHGMLSPTPKALVQGMYKYNIEGWSNPDF